MVNKDIISHELGHAISAIVQDNWVLPHEICLNETRMDTAMMLYHDVPKRGLTGKYSTLRGVSDLGGIFGELLNKGKWAPWGCRIDIETFISSCIKTKRPIWNEMDLWKNVEDDSYSFRKISVLVPFKLRKYEYFNELETECRLPNMFDIYKDFKDRIDIDEFNKVVNEIYKEKIINIDKDKLFGYIERITF